MLDLSPPVLSSADGQPVLYLALAGLCLILGLRFLRQASMAIAVILQAAATAAAAALALSVGLLLLVAAAITN